ncbi:hypothetical protein QN277_022100 [Acacia crassicarpa]|uniref:Angiotensin-converting enzyme 2 n=1 Tax=Acacia crassicarpa TaxID=499986 RepID=A0AAE1MQ89_9FABA|nr:hypothetical protein QN277_022100 [Acacia crassicarpa]
MKNSQSPKEEPSTQASHESQSEQPNNHTTDAPITDSGSASASGNESKKVSRQDIELVQNLIERCLQLYMNKDEVVKTLLTQAKIDPGFTTLVWQKLEEENADFFRAYYVRLKLKKQILLFNHLLENQYHLMKHSMAPIQNGIHPMPANNLPMGYPVLQQPPNIATGQPHLDSMGPGISSCHVVNGVPALSNFNSIQMNSGNDMVMDHGAPDMAPAIPSINSMSEMAVSPTSVASSGCFPFTASDLSGMNTDASALDTAFASEVGSSAGLQLAADGNTAISRPLEQIPWNFSLSDLTADLSNLGDLGALGNYPGSPFLPSDSDMLLESPDQDINNVDDFLVSSEPQCSQSDEQKS